MFVCIAGEYITNRCNSTDPNCIACTKRLYSCVGLPDGNNPVPGKHWTAEYITCFRNRTMGNKHCQKGIFDPVKRICISQIDTSKTYI